MSAGIVRTSYHRVHGDRRKLIMHGLAVRLFVVATLSLIVCLVGGDYVAAIIALAATFAAMALRGRGHAFEFYAPEPFSGPGNFLRRWFREQLLFFPMFVLTGRRWHRFKATVRPAHDAA